MKEINEEIIKRIIDYCHEYNIEYSMLDDILIINDKIYNQGSHLFYSLFEIEKSLNECKGKHV